jgi:Arm DNA-binding domain
VPRRKKIGNWGGRRSGAGRKRELGLSDRREIAGDYFACMQERRGNVAHLVEERRVKERRRRLMMGSVAGVLDERRPFREALIRRLMAEYNVTHRMVVRCVAEFLPNVRFNTKMYNHAIAGDELQPLPARNINKVKPGVYVEKRLRLVVDSTGKRTWIFRFLWGHTIRDMPLGGPEVSLTRARELATKASQKLAAGQNPIDDSWASVALQSAKSKT